jgi:hypothetical protein
VRRRRLIAGALGGWALARPALAAAQAARESGALTNLLRLEHTSVFAYDHVLASGALDRAQERLLRTLRAHEAEHAEALAKALTARGWPLPKPPDALEQVEIPQVRATLDAGDPQAAVAEVEALSDQVYRLAIGRLREAPHIQLVATILATEATHLVAWRAVR